MAAGKGKRMQPLTLETPKPLIKVNGVRMIDTIIRGLHANGITEIYVVVGYLKEKFSELPSEYPGLTLIENPYWDTCNNISSLATYERYAPGRVRIVQADAAASSTLADLGGSVDVVVTNPPYVPAGALEDVETASYDPRLALFGGGEDGLDLPVALVRRAGALLRDDGLLVMEHDAGQGPALREAALAGGFREASTEQDLTSRDRFLRAVR